MAANNDIERGYILGIDMGTTSVKVAVVDTDEVSVLYEFSKPIPDAYIVHNNEYSEQCVQFMVTQLDHCVGNIPSDLARKVSYLFPKSLKTVECADCIPEASKFEVLFTS